MKTIDFFCASQASTAITMSFDQPSSSSSSSTAATASIGGRAIDRHNPIIRDQKRAPRGLPLAPCTSQSPVINPQPYHLLEKQKKNTKNDTAEKAKTTDGNKKRSQKKDERLSNKQLVVGDDNNNIKVSNNNKDKDIVNDEKKLVITKSRLNRSDFITPPTSSRYLLGDKEFFDNIPDYDAVLPQISDPSKSVSTAVDKEKPSNQQVVVLRVSLHCRGCEGKVRKHVSRMEGVRSFSIDFAAKKVTIVGDVTPLSALASVSKVKNAQFWTPPAIAIATHSLLNNK